MKIIINTIGKEKSLQLHGLINEYIKRIPWKIDVKEYVYDKKGAIDEIKEAEANLLLSSILKKSFKIALDENGNHLSSIELADLLKKIVNAGESNIEFFIGGASGLAPKVKEVCNYTLSLSKMTFAHKLARLMIIEQIYRAYTIINHHPYHK